MRSFTVFTIAIAATTLVPVLAAPLHPSARATAQDNDLGPEIEEALNKAVELSPVIHQQVESLKPGVLATFFTNQLIGNLSPNQSAFIAGIIVKGKEIPNPYAPFHLSQLVLGLIFSCLIHSRSIIGPNGSLTNAALKILKELDDNEKQDLVELVLSVTPEQSQLDALQKLAAGNGNAQLQRRDSLDTEPLATEGQMANRLADCLKPEHAEKVLKRLRKQNPEAAGEFEKMLNSPDRKPCSIGDLD
ncbi:hypothetical protein FRB99_003050 [Tulasnella sp. 403]|nr:hypothetical protein FRB99_003050 [Tulasnella sp. 403]